MPQTFDLSSRYQLLSPSDELIWMLQQAAFSTWQWWWTWASSIKKGMCPAKNLTPVIAKGFLRVSAARGLSSGDYKLSQETESVCTTHSKLQHRWFGERKVIWHVKKVPSAAKKTLRGNPQVIYGKTGPLNVSRKTVRMCACNGTATCRELQQEFVPSYVQPCSALNPWPAAASLTNFT